MMLRFLPLLACLLFVMWNLNDTAVIQRGRLTSLHQGVVKESRRSDLAIDLISVGSMTRPALQVAQAGTFATHPAVRHFFRVTELNDTDSSCYVNFTKNQLSKVLRFCKNTVNQTLESISFRKGLFRPRRHAGWLCAQKRPIDGLRIALKHYETAPLPSYLMIIDDDTYVNMNATVETLRESYPEHESRVVAGCLILKKTREATFVFPYGGFGSILTRAAIERIRKPIFCNNSDAVLDDFTRLTCWRLGMNHVGEKNFFKEGMSVGDLMFTYSSELPFSRVNEWKGTGYCFHSDHALAYFFNFYHIGAPLKGAELNENIRANYSFESLVGKWECRNKRKSCTAESRLCHFIKPSQMESLYAEQQTIPKL